MAIKQKSLIVNSIYNVAYKVLNILFPLITTTYTSHILLADGIGLVASVQNIVQYFVFLAALGIPSYGTREIAKKRDNFTEKSKLFSELFFINIISTLFCVILYFIMIANIAFFNKYFILYCVAGFNIVLNFFNVDWYYQGIEEYKYITIRSSTVKLMLLLLVVLFVRNKSDVIVYMLLSAVAIAGNYIFNILNLRKTNVKLILKGLDFRPHIKPIFILLCISVSVELYTMVDTTMMTFLCEANTIGYYNNSIKLVKMAITVITAIGGVLLPRMSYYYIHNDYRQCNQIINRVLNILFFLILPCGIGIFLTSSDLIFVLFGESFTPAYVTLQILSFLVYALGFSNLFSTQVLLTFGCEKKILLCTVLGAISNVCINAFMIPLFQQNGAAIASLISEFLVMLSTCFFSRKYISYKLDIASLKKELLSCLIMIILVLFLKRIMPQGVLRLLLCVGTGGLFYLLSNMLFKNQILLDAKSLLFFTKSMKFRNR